MKIVIFRTGAIPIDIKKYNVQEIGIAKAELKKGNQCDIILYSPSEDKDEVISTEYGEIKIYWRRAKDFFHHGIFEWDEILRIVSNYDVVQCSEYYQIATYKMLEKHIKPVVIYHGPYDSVKRWKASIIDKVFDIFYLRKMRKMNPEIICKSFLALNSLKKRGFEKLHMGGVGLDVSRFGEEKSNAVKENKMLYIGAIEPRRNTVFLLDILDEYIKKYGKDINLTIIGNGKNSYVDKVKKNIDRKGLGEYVTLINQMNQADLVKYYTTSKVFLLPTDYEIFGMVLLESEFFGLPAISTYNGGSSVVINSKEDGMIIDRLDAKEWARAVSYYFENEIKAGEFNYTWDAIIDKFNQVYQEAVDSFENKEM